jgi:transposase
MRQAKGVSLTPQEKLRLQWLVSSEVVAVKVVERARMLLLAETGFSNKEIAEQLNTTRQKVARWRQRFIEQGLEGIEKDASRPGGKEKLDQHVIEKVINLTLHHQPSIGKYWTQQSIARHCGISRSSVGRIWKKHNISPK